MGERKKESCITILSLTFTILEYSNEINTGLKMTNEKSMFIYYEYAIKKYKQKKKLTQVH